MQMSNGRANGHARRGKGISINKLLRNRHSKDRLSAYSGARPIVSKNPDMVSLPQDKISRCLRAVELALGRSNRDEAVAAVERAFLVPESNNIAIDSHFEELGLSDKIVDVLNIHGIYTIRDLLLGEKDSLYRIKGLKETEVNTLISSVENQGFRFSDAEDDA